MDGGPQGSFIITDSIYAQICTADTSMVYEPCIEIYRSLFFSYYHVCISIIFMRDRFDNFDSSKYEDASF